jgi:hypothetical protein
MKLTSFTFDSMMSQHPGPRPLIPGLAIPGKVSLILQSEKQATEWLSHSIAVRATCGQPIGPITNVQESAVVLVTSASARESQELISAISAKAPAHHRAAISRRFRLTNVDPSGDPAAFLDPSSLRCELEPGAELLVISDLRLFLKPDDRHADTAEKIGPVLLCFGRMAKAGLSIVAFVPQRSGPKPVDLHEYLNAAALIRLEEDPGGPRDTGASVLLYRDRTGPLDKVPAFFRLLATEAEGALVLNYDFSGDDPIQAKEERLQDRNIMILQAELAGRPRKELSDLFRLSESRLSRLIKETRERLGPERVALLAQDAQATGGSDLEDRNDASAFS